jgi:cytosine/uracil/thiamine/allantoin permease
MDVWDVICMYSRFLRISLWMASGLRKYIYLSVLQDMLQILLGEHIILRFMYLSGET